MALCSEALNPNISRDAVEEMLIQHLLTERLIRHVFDQENFVRRNVIAAEVEKVIDALTGQHFNRSAFLGSLDRFYLAIEKAADRLADFSDKQGFINTVYERFFQGFSVRVADTHGIVYTPQEVVEFMVAATDELLQREFGKTPGRRGCLRHRPLHRHRQLRGAICYAAWRARTPASWSAFTASGSSPTK